MSRLLASELVTRVVPAPAIGLIHPTESLATEAPADVTWGLKRLRIPDLWAEGLTGEGVLIGHLDTGIAETHPALGGAVAHYAEFDLLGRPVAGAAARDSGTHGTHTAGTIAGRRVGGSAVGVAPRGLLASAMVIEGGNVVARILGGMDWTVGLGVRVLNMSLGLRGYDDSFLDLANALRARNVLPVFAVGNESAGTSRSPGNYAEALSVGACNEQDFVASLSSSQRFERAVDPLVPDLVAPGVAVVSSMPGGGYGMKSGTSMATPHLAGLAALLIQARPEATASEVERAIFASCIRPPNMAVERANRGVPDAPRALAVLTSGRIT